VIGNMSTMQPLPNLSEPDTRPFWLATKDHELIYPVCNACGSIVFYPRAHCTKCTSRDLRYERSAGQGTVYSFTIVRANRQAPFSERIPYVVAWIDLDEGFRMMSNVVECEPLAVSIGQRVEVDWQDFEEMALPYFRVVGAPQDAHG